MRYSVTTMLVGLVAGGLVHWPTCARAQARHPVPAQVTLFNSGKPIKNSGSVTSNAWFPVEVYSAHAPGGFNVVLNVSTPIIQMSNVVCQVATGCVLQINNLSSWICRTDSNGPTILFFYTKNYVDGVQSDNTLGPSSFHADVNGNIFGSSNLLNSVVVTAEKHTVTMQYLAILQGWNPANCQIGNIEMDVTVLNR